MKRSDLNISTITGVKDSKGIGNHRLECGCVVRDAYLIGGVKNSRNHHPTFEWLCHLVNAKEMGHTHIKRLVCLHEIWGDLGCQRTIADITEHDTEFQNQLFSTIP